MLLDFDELDNTDELFSCFCVCIDMFHVCYLTLAIWTTWTSCLLASDCVRICLMYFSHFDKLDNMDKLDDMDEFSSVL